MGITAALGAASMGLKAYSQASAGRAAKDAADKAAGGMDDNANQAIAVSQVAADQERKKARMVTSSVQARAAASGAGASDNDVLKIVGDIAAEGEYRSLVALYEGKERSRQLKNQADVTRYEGRMAKRAGNVAALTTVLSGGTSLFDKYGGSSGGGMGYGTANPAQAGEGYPY